MGRQWLHSKREANANKKAKVTSKLVREITVAAKMGVPDPTMNARLGVAVEAARKQSVSNDTITRAIKKGSGQGDGAADFELVTFEGMAPHKVPVIVECMTDNRNRTAPDIRSLFKDGQFGSKVAFFFEHVGIVEATCDGADVDFEGAAIEAGAQDAEKIDSGDEDKTSARFLTDRTDLDAVTDGLRNSGWTVSVSELGYVAKDPVQLNPEQRSEVEEFLERIDDHDDVHRIYAAL